MKIIIEQPCEIRTYTYSTKTMKWSRHISLKYSENEYTGEVHRSTVAVDYGSAQRLATQYPWMYGARKEGGK